jgi:hypothetical protein
MSLYVETPNGWRTSRNHATTKHRPCCAQENCHEPAVAQCDQGEWTRNGVIRCARPLCLDHAARIGFDLHACPHHLANPPVF